MTDFSWKHHSKTLVTINNIPVHLKRDTDCSNTFSEMTDDARERIEKLLSRWPQKISCFSYCIAVFTDEDPGEDEELYVVFHDGTADLYFKAVIESAWTRRTGHSVNGPTDNPSSFWSPGARDAFPEDFLGDN